MLKFGTLVNHYQIYMAANSMVRGVLTFPSLTSLLLAQPSTIQGATPGSITDRTDHYDTLGWYLQDDLRVRSNVTLNLGLRYEFNTQLQEVHGIQAALRNIQQDATTTVGPLFKNPSLHDFSPRFGFAWDVKGDGKTAVRGGFGLLYDIGNFGTAIFDTISGTPPFSNTSTLQTPPAIALTLPVTFPASASGKSPNLINYSLQQPHMLQYNLTVDRQLPFDMALTLSYAGSRGLNLMQLREGNPTVPQILPDGQQFWTGSDPRKNPNWNNIRIITAGGNSWYNSLQVGFMKRLTKGLQLQSSYTYSKLIDDADEQVPADRTGLPADSVHRQLDRGPAAFDLTQNWRLNAIYRFPQMTSNGILRKVMNGWWTSGILSLQSGYPYELTVTNDRSRQKSGTIVASRPDLVPGRTGSNITHGVSAGCLGIPAGTKIGPPNLYYDPCAFTIPPLGSLGTLGRDFLRGPGLANLDFSLVKDSPLHFLGEGGKLEFRAEFFNILNRVNFATPGVGGGGGNTAGTIFAGAQNVEPPVASAGVPTNTATTSRQIQFALKIIF